VTRVDHISGETWHGRKGEVKNAFTYSIDYVLVDAEDEAAAHPALFARNGRGVMSLLDRDHGGPPGQGRGAAWVRDVLREHGLDQPGQIELLAQPRMLGHVFNPVSFWLCRDGTGALTCVIAEVSNTFGDRHSYLCHHDDQREIRPEDTLSARKIFHVSPFQDIGGGYRFNFKIGDERIAIRIDLTEGENGLVATLAGPRAPLTTGTVLRALLRRPLGSRRVLALIHWQALKLWWKGVTYRVRPEPPADEVSR
jgi:DUF1365 family protein